MHAYFVDRVEDLEALRSTVAGLGRRQGAALVVEGRSGVGKSLLLRRFAEEVGGGRSAPLRVVYTTCRAHTGQGFPFGPIINILSELGADPERRRGLGSAVRRTGRGAVQAAPDVLSALVPGLAPLIPLVRSVTESALRSGSLPGDSLQPLQQAIALRVAEEILRSARAQRPVVLIVDDAQFIDDSSLQVLDMLVQRLGSEPLAVVLGLATGAPSGGSRRTASQLVARWSADGLARRHRVETLPADAVAELVGLRHRSASPEFSARLAEVTGGLPLFVRLCLDRWQPQDGAHIALPDSVAEVVRDQMDGLAEQDRRLLSLAAVQGPVFLSDVLARSAGTPHDEVLERLRVLAVGRTLIKPVARPEWALVEAADVYGFDHLLLWDAVYHAQTEEQRRSRHERVAQVFAQAVEGHGQAPLGMRLELARHLELGGPPCARQSADVRLGLARSAAEGGLSLAEAETHCTVAIEAAKAMRPGRERDRRLVEAIEMLLSMTEVRWRGHHRAAGDPADIDGLAELAEQAAVRDGSPDLIAVTTLLRGKTLLATEGLEPALDKLARAVELAAGLDNPVRAYVARVEYGRQLGKRDLAAALEVLLDVERAYADDPRLADSGDLVLAHARNLAEMQLAVNLFDGGHLGDALDRLLRCVARLRGERLNAELPIAFNYLAQVQIALGRTEEAERILREALAFEEERGGDSGWHAYNCALLALVLSTDPRRGAQAAELIERAWLETERTWLANLVPIVRNLYAEVLLATATGQGGAAAASGDVLERADKLALTTCRETAESGMVRSRIAALSLRARIHLRSGRPTQAARFARESVRLLDEVGEMPALRTEEVYFHAAVVLRADGDQDEARELLERARVVVARKAGRIDDPLRRGFLRDVPLNRRIEEGLEC